MKKILLTAAIALLVTGCTTTTPVTRVVYSLDANQNLQANNVTTYEEDQSAKVWQTVLIVVGGVAGFYLLGEAFDIWDDDTPTTTSEPAQPFVLPASGSSSTEYTNSYILPDYQVVN